MIVENCWNGGVVIGAPMAVKPDAIIGVTGRQTLNGKQIGEGQSENPFATLAWLANLLAEREARSQSRHGGHHRQRDPDVLDRTGRPLRVHGRRARRVP